MNSPITEVGAESVAKAALLCHLRDRGIVSHRCVVTTELILDKYSVRADLVVCDQSSLHCFEIKTERDTLARLDRQLQTYSTHADFVTVVSASRHVNAVMSRVPDYVGIYEIVNFSTANEIRVVREPSRSPFFDANALLSILPVKDLQQRLLVGAKARRLEAVAEARLLPCEAKKKAVLGFLRERYLPNTLVLLKATRRRNIQAADLQLLRRWGRDRLGRSLSICNQLPTAVIIGRDEDTYNHVGQSFGPVPEEVRALMVG